MAKRNQKKQRGRMMIRRRSSVADEPPPAQKRAAVISPTPVREDGGQGFSGRNSIDFFGHDSMSDFVSDNELRLSDEIFAQYEETLGERVAAENKPTFDALGKLENALAGL